MWQTELVEIIRVLVWDMDSTRYTDDKLQHVAVVAAFQVLREGMSFNQKYVANVATIDITPDPTNASTKDESFVNLVCLKAACIIDRGNAAIGARQALMVKDGPITFDQKGQSDAKLKLLDKGWCAVYADTKLEYQSTKTVVAGAAIMTPFRLYANGSFNSYGRNIL